ncbi:hypothetical protein FB192DRAFT_1328006 [Mucor lusitanicus]|uniref:PUM-HD domain-containing protein n=2 Tax=Mucor circinelloides f. lusitanicus TaxID=29924 RepID=A0A8H4EZS0_MUCCL|nr:hypothetical protein FB192DRAFT_1328006 [Mucor lusitanicus]
MNVSSGLNQWFDQEQQEHDDQDGNRLLRRPRADTMPTQSTSHLMIDPNRHHHWRNEQSLQSPTTPTTDQLLKGDDNNTIASTFASLGLDDTAPPAASSSSSHAIHASHSYSSLQTLAENQEWYNNTHYFRGEDLRSSVANLRFSHQQQQQQNRPRAMSAVDQQQQQQLLLHQQQEENSPLLPHRSIWYSDINKQQQQFSNRPFLRSSNSSADLLEMIARQRKATATAANSPSGSHSIAMNEDLDTHHTGWTGDSFTAGGSLSSSYEQLSSSSMNLADMMMMDPSACLFDVPANQVPTRSLWLGQLELTHQTTNELQMIFSKFGIIESIRILPDRECAFINFTTVEEALRARDAIVNKMGGRLYAHSMATVKVGFGKPDAVPLNSVTSSPTATPTAAASAATNNLALAAAAAAANESTQGPTRALWVGNVPIHTTQAALGSVFSPFGMIESIRVLTHKNCGFINFFHQEDAVKAKKALQNKEIMGPGTGTVRIGYAKVPAVKSQHNNNNNTAAIGGLVGTHSDAAAAASGFQSGSSVASTTMMDVAQHHQQQQMLGNYYDDKHSQWHQTPQEQQQMMLYMMEMMGNTGSNANANVFSAVVTERKLIMQDFGEDNSDGPILDGMCLHLPQNYYHSIPAAPELGQSRKVDISRLRDIRKRLDTGHISTKELEVIAIECVDELVELCSDYIGNTVIQRLFERCSEMTKSIMLEAVAPFLASIGVHKNGTWAAQKIIDTSRLPAQISLICGHIKPYVPALLLDQFGNYVVQCCLGLGPNRNQFIFDAIVDSCWEIAQGRFGARAVRATLESPHVTKRQQKYVAASLVQHALLLATNANGALLLIWLLDTSGIPGRYRVLAPRLLPHLSKLCTHKLASLTVLKLINQRQEPEARVLILDALFFSNSSINNNMLHDQVHGVSLVQKILSSSYIELRERQRIAERVKYILCKLKLQHVQGYKRLMEEINMVMMDSTPGASLGVTLPGQFSINPNLAAALQAKYMVHDEDGVNNEDPTAAMMANFYAAAAAAAAAATAAAATTTGGASHSHTACAPIHFGDPEDTTRQ